MCFIGLEDFTDQVEVVVFPRIFEKTSRWILPDMPVVVTGRLNIGDEAVKVIADNIAPLDGAAKEIRLKLIKRQESPQTFDQLKDVFAKYHGKTAVYLHYVDGRRVVKIDPQYWLEPLPEAIAALEKILGKEAVQVV